MTSSRIRLSFEWTQIATHLAQQVLCAHQIGFSAFQPALGFFFPLAVFQYARRFFDDRPTIFGSRVQHRINLTLANDHVLLSSDAGIGQQFLDVEKSTFGAVNRIFAFAAAEQRSAHRHFGEVDRQQPVLIVDRQGYLGSAEGGSLGSARKDHVVHFLGAHR